MSEMRRASALIIIIEMIMARYQNVHGGNLDEEIFQLFEKAKNVARARDYTSLDEAIKGI